MKVISLRKWFSGVEKRFLLGRCPLVVFVISQNWVARKLCLWILLDQSGMNPSQDALVLSHFPCLCVWLVPSCGKPLFLSTVRTKVYVLSLFCLCNSNQFLLVHWRKAYSGFISVFCVPVPRWMGNFRWVCSTKNSSRAVIICRNLPTWQALADDQRNHIIRCVRFTSTGREKLLVESLVWISNIFSYDEV